MANRSRSIQNFAHRWQWLNQCWQLQDHIYDQCYDQKERKKTEEMKKTSQTKLNKTQVYLFANVHFIQTSRESLNRCIYISF